MATGTGESQASSSDHATIFLSSLQPLRKKKITNSSPSLLCGTSSVERSRSALFPSIEDTSVSSLERLENDQEQSTRCSSVDAVTVPVILSPPLTPNVPVVTPGRIERNQEDPQATIIHLTTINGLQIFDREVEDAMIKRFNDVKSQLLSALLDYLRRRRVSFRPLTAQLMLLGRTEAGAIPSIVFTCPEDAKSKVERFLKKKAARNVYYGPKFCLYRFDFAVVGRPLTPTGSESPDEVFFEQEDPTLFDDWTPRIKVGQPGMERFATVGGFVSIIGAQDNKKSLYGLTAGHILPDGELYTNDDDMLSDSDTEDELGEDDMDDVDDKDNLLFVTNEEDIEDREHVGGAYVGFEEIDTAYLDEEPVFAFQGSSDASTLIDTQDKRTWTSLGTMAKASYSYRARNRDWALIELPSIESGEIKGFSKDSSNELRKAARATGERSAIIGDRSRRRCKISALPASAILPSGFDFVDAHVLQIPDGECKLTSSVSLQGLTICSTTKWILRLMDHCFRSK